MENSTLNDVINAVFREKREQFHKLVLIEYCAYYARQMYFFNYILHIIFLRNSVYKPFTNNQLL